MRPGSSPRSAAAGSAPARPSADRTAAARPALACRAAAVRSASSRWQGPGNPVAPAAGRSVPPLPSGRRASLALRGPERVALVGSNGAGKTTLLEQLAGGQRPFAGAVGAGEVRVMVPTRYLPQRLDLLDDTLSVADNVARLAPGTTPHDVRAGLARFLLRGRRADQAAGSLSGGERLRATLAALLLAEPAPQLLLLDEPTNSLDTDSVARLTEALAGFRGALLVASHDEDFLEGVGVTRVLDLDAC